VIQLSGAYFYNGDNFMIYRLFIRFLAAGVIAIASSAAWPAQAAVEYVRVCSVFGTGWFYIPGTAKCINPSTGVIKEQTATGDVTSDSELRKDVLAAKEGVALSLALPTATVEPGKTFGAAFNVGTFGGDMAIGVGGAVRAADGLTFTGAIGVGLSQGNVGGRGGVNFSW
jgi:hypothetical protein